MSLRDYFAIRAPKEIPERFEPVQYGNIPISEFKKYGEIRFFQWRWYYADIILVEREK